MQYFPLRLHFRCVCKWVAKLLKFVIWLLLLFLFLGERHFLSTDVIGILDKMRSLWHWAPMKFRAMQAIKMHSIDELRWMYAVNSIPNTRFGSMRKFSDFDSNRNLIVFFCSFHVNSGVAHKPRINNGMWHVSFKLHWKPLLKMTN